jgi:hypothetical protein
MGVVENVGKAERLLRSFFQAPSRNHQKEVRRRRTLFDFHGAAFSTTRRARRVFEICGKDISGHAASATNKRHRLLRRLGMDFRAETTRFGPTSHTQMSSELTTQDSTIGPAQDQSQVVVYLKGRNYFGMKQQELAAWIGLDWAEKALDPSAG